MKEVLLMAGHAVVTRVRQVCLLVAVSVVPVASGAAAESLKQALADAYAWHPSIQTARAGVRIAQAAVRFAEVGNGVLATGNVNAFVTERSVSPGPSETKPVASARVGLTKRLVDFGRVREDVLQQQAMLDAARYQLQVVEQQVLYEAVVAYLNVFRAEARLQLARKGEELVRSDLQATQERFEVGDVTPTDVAQAEARLADRRADRLNREQDLEHAHREYRLVTGSNFSESAAYPTERPALPASEQEVENDATTLHPAVLMRRARVAASTHSLDAAVLEALPTFQLESTATYSENPNTFFDSLTDLSVGITGTIPLLSGGRLGAGINHREETLHQSRRELDSEMRAVRFEALGAWHRFRSASETIMALEASTRANRIASEGVRREAEVGNRTTLDVLNANQELLIAEDRLDEARHAVEVAAYGLLNATGRMTAEHWGL